MEPDLDEVVSVVLPALEADHLGSALRVAAQPCEVDAAECALLGWTEQGKRINYGEGAPFVVSKG